MPGSFAPGHQFRSEKLLNDGIDQSVVERRKQMRNHRSGRCGLARAKLHYLFNTRRYFIANFALTLIECLLVLIRMILEMEQLRIAELFSNLIHKQFLTNLPCNLHIGCYTGRKMNVLPFRLPSTQPGSVKSSILTGQLALGCISMFILTAFIIEIPFKMWALEVRRCGQSLFQVLDALICIACWAICVYNIDYSTKREDRQMASKEQILLCGLTHTTMRPESWRTSALVCGWLIAFRFWIVKGYMRKSRHIVERKFQDRIEALEQDRTAALERVDQVESLLATQQHQAPSNSGYRAPGGRNPSYVSGSSQRGRPMPKPVQI